MAGVVAIALPFTALVAEYAAKLQNIVVEWAASLPYGHLEVAIPEWAMWMLYAIFAVATLLVWMLPKREKEIKIEG